MINLDTTTLRHHLDDLNGNSLAVTTTAARHLTTTITAMTVARIMVLSRATIRAATTDPKAVTVALREATTDLPKVSTVDTPSREATEATPSKVATRTVGNGVVAATLNSSPTILNSNSLLLSSSRLPRSPRWAWEAAWPSVPVLVFSEA